MALERGSLLYNRYRIVDILGQGGMGAVYRAIDENLGVEVAVKENLFTTDEYARQFRREAVILASLRHPNLPRVTDHFVIENQGQYLVMDYIEGEDLRQRMDRVGVIPEEEAIIIGAAICDALSYLDSRSQPIIHRDIKPGNVKITPNGHIYLVDFGLAKIYEGSQATTTGARAMTPGYSPPEQYGTARTDHRSDLFSLGATLYAALTGAIPEDALARAMDQVELTTIRKRNPRISKRLAMVLEKALEIRPDDRYQNAEEFRQALLNASNTTRGLTGDYVVDPPPEVPEISSGNNNLNTPGLSSEGITPSIESATPVPIFNRPAMSDSSRITRSRPRQKPRRNVWMVFLLLAMIILGGAVIIYTYFPNWSTQALAWFMPSPSNVWPALASDGTPTTELQALPGISPTPSLNLPVDLPSPTATITRTPRPPTPTTVPPTRTLVPTPVGGGAGQIAFASNRTGTNQIYLIDVDGNNLVQLTELPEGACQPDWSPDGLRLVFTSPCERNQESYPGSGLFIINADGSGLMPLQPPSPGGDYDPDWSPDGKKIVFTSLRSSGRPRLYMLNLEDNTITRLSNQYSRDFQPAWSPDGTRIAFVTTQKGPTEIWTMNPDGSSQQRFSQSGVMINTHPAWSLDGRVILFTQMEYVGGIPHLAAASYNEGVYTEFLFNLGPIPLQEAAYSPDGLWLSYESWPEGSNHEIYIMVASGANQTRVTNHPFRDFDPAWRPIFIQP